MKTKYIFLVSFFLLNNCFLIEEECHSGTHILHPDNQKKMIMYNLKKGVYINNRTKNTYKNNALYSVSLRQKVATGTYELLLKPDSETKINFLHDIAPEKTIIKKEPEMFFISIFLGKLGISPTLFKDTNYIFYLAYLDGGKRKVFFAPNKKDKEGRYYNNYFNYGDKTPRDDGKCYYFEYWQAKEIFVKDTHITIETDKATSNHKVVTNVILGGKRIDLATLPMKKVILDKDYDFLRVEDFN